MKKVCTRIIALLLCLLLMAGQALAVEPTVPAQTQLASESETEAPAGSLPVETEAPTEALPVETEAPAETPAVETEAPTEAPAVETEAPTEAPAVEAEAPARTLEADATAAAPTAEATAEAKQPPKPFSEMTDEEIVEWFSLKTKWSRAALIFAVRNGLMVGVSEHDLAPKNNTTQAELATIMLAILKTQKAADLSGYKGVKRNAWYYSFMQRAVSLGMFPVADPASKVLTPNVNVTREEVFVVMARLFGIKSDSRQGIYRFSDWADVSDWAANEISAMIEHGHLAGNNGKILPKAKITREELAVVIMSFLNQLGTEMDTRNFTGRMALASATVPANTTVNGDLILSTDVTSITLDHLTVTGRLILQGNDMADVTMTGCNVQELVLARSAIIHSDKKLKNVTVLQAARLYCSAAVVNVFGAMIVYESSTLDTVNMMNQSCMTVYGTIRKVNILGEQVYINGTGNIQTLECRGSLLGNDCPTGKTIENPYNTLTTATATCTDSWFVTESNQQFTMGLKLSNMPEGWSECDLQWYVDGDLISSATRILLKEGSVIKAKHNFHDPLFAGKTSSAVKVFVTCQGKRTQLYQGSVTLETPLSYWIEHVRTQNVQGWLKTDGMLYTRYSYNGGYQFSGPIAQYPAGTQVTILQSRESSVTKVRMQDGRVGWMSFSNVEVSTANFYTTEDYPQNFKEYYVNKMRNCTSSTSYLIWVSLYTQRINIFKGSKGNWKLIRTGPIASGRNPCPTPVEVTKILYKTTQWSYQYYYCHHVSVFDEARGFHSRPTRYASDGGGICDWSIGFPASAGCIRLMDEDCIFLYDSVPTGTAVYIY